MTVPLVYGRGIGGSAGRSAKPREEIGYVGARFLHAVGVDTSCEHGQDAYGFCTVAEQNGGGDAVCTSKK